MEKEAGENKKTESEIRNFFERFDEKPGKRKRRIEKTETIPVEQEKTTEKETIKEVVLKPGEIKIIRTGEGDLWG